MRRSICLIVTLGLAACASANYSMEPAFSIFAEITVFVYIFALIASEEWIIGKDIDQSWGRIIFTCFAANFITALIGFVIGIPRIGMVMLPDTINPNPILTSIFALTIYAAISVPLETLIWMSIRKEMSKS